MIFALPSGFSIGSLQINFYALCILTGIVFAVWQGLREARRLGVPSDVIFLGVLIIVPISIVGARVWYVIYNVEKFHNFAEVLGFYDGHFEGLSGLAIQGGVIAALISIIVYCWKRKVSLFVILDIVAPGFLIGQIFGRWGNFFNQELFGPVVKNPAFLKAIPILGDQMYIYGPLPDGGFGEAYRHPCFLYEGMLNLIGLIAIFVGRRKLKIAECGDYMGFYLFWYGCVRIPIECLRLNSGVSDPIMLGDSGIPVSIVTAVVFIVLGIAFLVLKRTVLVKIYPRKKYMELADYVAANKIDTIIFDLDGTLLNTRPLIDASFVHTFEQFRPGYNLTEEELDSFFGPTLESSFSKYANSEDEVKEMCQCYREYNLAHHDEIVKPFYGAKDMLKAFKSKHYQIAVVSSKKKELVLHGLEFCGLSKYIDLVLGADDVTNHKPDPEGINKALIELNMERKVKGENASRDDSEYKKHSLYVGDTKSDIEAAKNAGIRSCGVLYIKHPEIMLEVTPDYVINKLPELVSICGE